MAKTMSVRWSDLRSWRGSQQAAFEELCCQLASREHISGGTSFHRKGTPDAGVECYWVTKNRDEHGWQAKFFRDRPENAQWQQIDESVNTALTKHPRLVSYTICLPADLSDARIGRRLSSKDAWDAHVKKWQGWAKTRKMRVRFSFWGDHEIWERLWRPEHRGRVQFWFNKDLLDDEWFRARIEEAISDAGPRYTQDLNVELPISRVFEGLGRTPTFFKAFADAAVASESSLRSAQP